jgi:hypothetical protein
MKFLDPYTGPEGDAEDDWDEEASRMTEESIIKYMKTHIKDRALAIKLAKDEMESIGLAVPDDLDSYWD